MSLSPSAAPPTPAHPKRRRILTVLMTLMLGVGLACGAWWYFVLQYEEKTDDAYVAGNVVRIMPLVPGRVLEVLADDTDRVRAGQELVRLDSHDARLALQQAEVELATVVRDVCRLQAQWRESAAQIDAAQTTWQQAVANLQRREVLGKANAVRVEEVQNYRAQVRHDAAQLEAARERRLALEAQLLQGPVELQPRVVQAAVKVRQCWLTLQRTSVRSPVDGQVAQRSVQSGAVLTAGTPLMAVIPLHALWVDANFKEVQLRAMRLGQPATVRVDMHGSSVTYQGRVAGFAAGTGSAFSLIPPQNATGNWIKIVQRVPVRIELDSADLKAHPLLVGLSSVVTVDIRQNSGPLLVDSVRQRPLPDVLQARGVLPDTADLVEIDAAIGRIIEKNVLQAASAPGAGSATVPATTPVQ